MSHHQMSPKKKMAYARWFIKQNREYADIGTYTANYFNYSDVGTQTERNQFNECVCINPQQAAFACLVEGIGFLQFKRLLLFINIDPPPWNQFFDAQNALCKALLDYARYNCSIYLSQVENGEADCFDGSWSQKRHAKNCFGAFWTAHLRKFIDFYTISLLSNPDLTSKLLEPQILRNLAERHKGDTRFKYFVHDKDTKAYKLIRDEIKWNLEERLYFTHTTKSWERIFEKRKMLGINGIKNRTNVLSPLEDSLLRWFDVSLKQIIGKLFRIFCLTKNGNIEITVHALIN